MNKIRTKEELKQELEQWKTMLSREVYSYLEALIKLDDYILNNNPTAPNRFFQKSSCYQYSIHAV